MLDFADLIIIAYADYRKRLGYVAPRALNEPDHHGIIHKYDFLGAVNEIFDENTEASIREDSELMFNKLCIMQDLMMHWAASYPDVEEGFHAHFKACGSRRRLRSWTRWT